MPGRNRLLCQRAGPLFHGVVPFGKGPGHVRIAHTLDSRDEPGDQVSGLAAPAPGGMGPAVDPAMENGGDIGGISQGSTRDKPWQDLVDVETACFGVAQSGEERAPGRTVRHDWRGRRRRVLSAPAGHPIVPLGPR